MTVCAPARDGVAERVTLVAADGRFVGSELKSAVHGEDTPLHLGFSLFLFDGAGRALMQRRAETKKTWGGVWSNACCGHPAPGEPFDAAIRRRLQHELGMDGVEPVLALPDFRYRACWNGIWENELCPVYIAYCDRESTPNPDEVAEVAWIDWARFAEASVCPLGTPFADYSPWSVLEAAELRRSPALGEACRLWRSRTRTVPPQRIFTTETQ